MNATLISRFYLLLSLLYLVFANAEAKPYPIGISFGPTYITAAYIDSTGEPVIVASIKGSDEYINFMADSAENEGVKIQYLAKWYIRDGESFVEIPPDPKNNPEVEDILTTAIQNIRKEITNSLGKPLDITSISIPNHFNGTSAEIVTKVAMANEKGIIRPWQVRRKFNVVRLAYGLNSCEGFGLDPDTCDDEDLDNVMFIDYNKAYLELLLASIGEFGCGALDSVRLYKLGAKRLESSEDSLEKYQHEIQGAIQNFKDKNSVRIANYSTTVELILAIVMSGDAPRPAFLNIRDAITAVLPEHRAKIRDSVDPLFTEAVGAAHWAKLQALKPEMLQDFIADSILDHDEL
ncbi:uncharacterized protein GIQ15_06044 [Arthroderma uncinatum]|uniref:uncharacterized protein n=1 Tax=Arthroderma uncinatum TaxID=74035 RepID=UPI00144AE7DA|nr:uncharacterized protein GIQ15_06044 [Arthroderma uncinatum]KAF3480697.1 hypothetical protein GIQ15_06044 [Arthroderma uncinatum]